MEIEDYAIIIINNEGKSIGIGDVNKLRDDNGLKQDYHSIYLKKYCLNKYSEELKTMIVDNGEYTVPFYAWFLCEHGNSVFANAGNYQMLFLPNKVTEEMQEILDNLSDFFNEDINLVTNLTLENGVVKCEEKVGNMYQLMHQKKL